LVGTVNVVRVTGAVFAYLGNDVVCVYNALKKIERFGGARMPIYEPGLVGDGGPEQGHGLLTFPPTDLRGVRRRT